jgi:SAM-dependent methyltransferase
MRSTNKTPEADPRRPEYWDKRAAEFAHDPERMVGWAEHPFALHQRYVENLLAGLTKPGDRILDVACGYGRFAQHVRELGCEWVGLDFSPRMRDLWRDEVASGRFVLADVGRRLPALGKFDLVLFVGDLRLLDCDVERFYCQWLPYVRAPGQIATVGACATEIRHVWESFSNGDVAV